MPACGNYHDNRAVLRAAEDALDRGRLEEGIGRLSLLRRHILATQEAKSVRHLLPLVDELFATGRSAARLAS